MFPPDGAPMMTLVGDIGDKVYTKNNEAISPSSPKSSSARGPAESAGFHSVRWRIPARHGGFREGRPVNAAVRAGPDLKPGGPRGIRFGVIRELLFQLATADPPGNLLLAQSAGPRFVSVSK
jgi:hypothetical protein